MAYYHDRFSKTQYKTADRMARLKAEGMAESFNEPSYILEGPNEFFVVRGLVWPYRNDKNPSWREDWPAWAKKDPDSFLVETVFPKDHLAGNYAKVRKVIKKMQEDVREVQYEQRFRVDQMCRDYSDVRMTLQLVDSAANTLSSVLIHLEFAVNAAIEEHKKKGK